MTCHTADLQRHGVAGLFQQEPVGDVPVERVEVALRPGHRAGQVDGRIRISFRGNQAYAQRISGGEIAGQQVNFGSSLPRRATDVAVNKLRGRGDVNVVERPSAQNNYAAVVEIDDRDSGSDVYEFELNWR